MDQGKATLGKRLPNGNRFSCHISGKTGWTLITLCQRTQWTQRTRAKGPNGPNGTNWELLGPIACSCNNICATGCARRRVAEEFCKRRRPSGSQRWSNRCHLTLHNISIHLLRDATSLHCQQYDAVPTGVAWWRVVDWRPVSLRSPVRQVSPASPVRVWWAWWCLPGGPGEPGEPGVPGRLGPVGPAGWARWAR